MQVVILKSDTLSSMLIKILLQEVYIVGGNIDNETNKGNVFTVPSNEHAEFNIFLDPLAAKTVFESKLNITLIPLQLQKRVNSFCAILNKLGTKSGTPESAFSERLLSRLWQLQLKHSSYHHVVTLLLFENLSFDTNFTFETKVTQYVLLLYRIYFWEKSSGQ